VIQDPMMVISPGIEERRKSGGRPP